MFLALLAVAGSRDAVTPYPPEWPHRAPWKLNRDLLVPTADTILFVVDVPRGAEPKPEALDHLALLASTYGQRAAHWVRLGEPSAPAVRWIAQGDRKISKPLVSAPDSVDEERLSADAKDSVAYFAQVPSCPNRPLNSSTSYVFVRFLGQWGAAYGVAGVVTADQSCELRSFPVIYLAQDRIARERAPGITRAYLETRALAHEYGHLLGLGTNPEHGRWTRIGPYSGRAHCVNRECAVAIPTAKSLLKGHMRDYCADCQRDIRQAQEHWLTGKEFPDVPRLPQVDPATYVERLKPRNFRPGGEADKLLRFEKAVVPALIDRLDELPGKRRESPRHYATRLVLQILVAEDLRRHGAAADSVRHLTPPGDHAEALRAWWNREERQFRTGDEWTLPDFMKLAHQSDSPP